MPGIITWIGSAALGAWAAHALARRFTPRASARAVPQLDLAALDVVLPRAEAQALRGELERLVSSRTPTLAHEAIARALMARREAWTHVAVRSWPVASAESIEARMRAARDELRERPDVEVPPELPPEGRGYRGGPGASATDDDAHAMISILVLAGTELPEVSGTPVARAEALLARLAAAPRSVIEAVEIHWVPALADEERALRALLALSPRLTPVAGSTSP